MRECGISDMRYSSKYSQIILSLLYLAGAICMYIMYDTFDTSSYCFYSFRLFCATNKCLRASSTRTYHFVLATYHIQNIIKTVSYFLLMFTRNDNGSVIQCVHYCFQCIFHKIAWNEER